MFTPNGKIRKLNDEIRVVSAATQLTSYGNRILIPIDGDAPVIIVSVEQSVMSTTSSPRRFEN